MMTFRSGLGLASALVLLAGMGPAGAQFGSVFGPPRPPADIAPPGEYHDDRYPREPGYDPWRRQRAPEPPPPPLTRLPPGSQVDPPPGVQTQPLPPPPGGSAAPQTEEANRPPITGPGQPPLVGLPPGQRQPRGEPQPGFTAGQPDGIVVPPPKERVVNPTAVFAGLDKITGRIISFDVSIDETVQFGALRLTPRACYTRPPTEPPNTDGFVEVDEITLQGEVKRIFTGWMFAASPGLHAVEHPIYDVWLTECKQEAPQVASAAAPGSAPANEPAQRPAGASEPPPAGVTAPRNPPNPPIRR
jgi:hypothetical protein